MTEKCKDQIKDNNGNILEDINNLQDNFDVVEDIEDKVVETNNTTDDDMSHEPFSKEWTDYVLSLMQDEELDNGKPRCDGLKRVALNLLGPHEPDLVVHAVSQQYAAVTYTAKFKKLGSFVGSAECHSGNTDSPFVLYPLATAETRAIGRALKNALALRILTAEETSKKADLSVSINDEDRTEGGITATQIKFIDRTCKNLDLNVKDVVESVIGNVDNIEELSHGNALKINEALDDWKREDSAESKPNEPYDDNWQFYFSKKK